MRLVLLISLVSLGVTRADEGEVSLSTLSSEDEEQEVFLDVFTDEQVFRYLFEGDVGEDADTEEIISSTSDTWEGRSRFGTPASEDKLSAKAQQQYNALVDTLFRRINNEARKLDPMMVLITPDKKKSGIMKKHRYPKVLDLEEVEDISDNDNIEQTESEHHIERREAAKEEAEDEEDGEGEEGANEFIEEGRRLYSHGEDENKIDAQSRRIQLPRKKKTNKKKPNRNGNGKGKDKNKRKQNKKKTKKTPSKKKKNKKNNKNNGKNKKRSGNRKAKSQSNRITKNGNNLPSVRTSRAEVTGFATLRRDGDVKLISRPNGITEVKTDIVTGPVNLKVTRKFGIGKDAITRIGNVASPRMIGSMVITLDAPGKKQKITKFQILRPSIVTTHGSLAKEPTKRKDNNFLENTLPRATPVVTKKLMMVARDILNAQS